MGIQDDIFDIEDRLEGTAEAAQFDQIIDYIAELEREIDVYRAMFSNFENLKLAMIEHDKYMKIEKNRIQQTHQSVTASEKC